MKIKIVVEGQSGSGKTCVVSLIKELLKFKDVKYTLDESALRDYGNEENLDRKMYERLLSAEDILIKNNVEIVIEEKQMMSVTI